MIEMLTCAIPTMMPHIQRAELEGRANHPHLPQQNLKKNLDGLAYGILFFFLGVLRHPPSTQPNPNYREGGALHQYSLYLSHRQLAASFC